MSTRTYTVEGTTCGHCANAVTGEVTKVPGVTDVRIDLDAKTVSVTGDPIDDAGWFLAAQQVPWQGRIDSGPNWSNAKHRSPNRW